MSVACSLREAIDEAAGHMMVARERWPRLNDQQTRRWWPQWLRNAIIERDGGCRGCGRSWGPFEIDHIFPRSMFRPRDTHWADRTPNLQALCLDCNRDKSNRRQRFSLRPGISGSCVACAPPLPEYDDPTKRWPCWCIRCGTSSLVASEAQIQ